MGLKNNRQSRESRLEQALEILSIEGIQGVRVERLARNLGITKGSFYWHFKDKAELERSLIEYWDSQFTKRVINNPEHNLPDVSQSIFNAMRMVRVERLDRYEMTVRHWADHDREVASMVRKVYDQREKFFKGLFLKLGFRGEDLEVRVRLLLCFLSWEPNMMLKVKIDQDMSHLQRYHEFLTRK